MELKDFVAQSLAQIAKGVVEAQKELEEIGGKVNPEMSKILKGSESGYEAHGWAKGEGANPVFLVSFDVALTAEEGTKTKGGIGVVAGVFALGSQGASNESSSAISRIQFKVPLLLPMHKNAQKDET